VSCPARGPRVRRLCFQHLGVGRSVPQQWPSLAVPTVSISSRAPSQLASPLIAAVVGIAGCRGWCGEGQHSLAATQQPDSVACSAQRDGAASPMERLSSNRGCRTLRSALMVCSWPAWEQRRGGIQSGPAHNDQRRSCAAVVKPAGACAQNTGKLTALGCDRG